MFDMIFEGEGEIRRTEEDKWVVKKVAIGN